ncbi:CBS domain-containing protein [Bacillus sp. N3536]|nr:CBS domain-containing protein [Bacillus sp. N3536]
MKQWKDILVRETTSLFNTMKVIDDSSLQFAVVVDENQRLLGTVTDGDIRRGILRGEGLEVEIHHVMNKNPLTVSSGKSRSYYLKLLKKNKVKQLPIIDESGKIVDIIFADNSASEQESTNTVILMVGGLGSRLRPLTNDIPKPMLHVGNKPILETIIDGFKQNGFTNFILSVNYKKEIIQDYFLDGADFGVSISYVEEKKRMGTAGALSLLNEKPKTPVFVMNGDLLTQVNFEQLLQFHKESNAIATMCVREYEYQIPYGVIETEGQLLKNITEKPIHRNFVNAGIYVLNPEAFDHIPKSKFFDMPDLFELFIENKLLVSAFPIRENWLDIGRLDDYERANYEYREQFK